MGGDNMGLQIEKTNALIGVKTADPKLGIKTQPAKLEIHQRQAQIKLQNKHSKLLIDQYESFASAGLKNNADITAEAAQKGYQKFIAYVGKTAEDGDMLAAIEDGGNPIAYISKRDSSKTHVFGLDFIPKVGPKFDIKVTENNNPMLNAAGYHNGVEGQYIPGNIKENFIPGQVDIYLRQNTSIKMKYIPNTIDYQV
jgi:hypothetical protein